MPVFNSRSSDHLLSTKSDSPTKLFEGYTDQSGKTEIFPLPAPPLSLAQAPENEEPVYAEYNLLVEADGFIPTINYSLAVFDKVTSLQNINLIPKTVFSDNAPIVTDEGNNYEL